jgi:hypothetical protein
LWLGADGPAADTDGPLAAFFFAGALGGAGTSADATGAIGMKDLFREITAEVVRLAIRLAILGPLARALGGLINPTPPFPAWTSSDFPVTRPAVPCKRIVRPGWVNRGKSCSFRRRPATS